MLKFQAKNINGQSCTSEVNVSWKNLMANLNVFQLPWRTYI